MTEEIGSSPRITAFFLDLVRVASCCGVSLALQWLLLSFVDAVCEFVGLDHVATCSSVVSVSVAGPHSLCLVALVSASLLVAEHSLVGFGRVSG